MSASEILCPALVEPNVYVVGVGINPVVGPLSIAGSPDPTVEDHLLDAGLTDDGHRMIERLAPLLQPQRYVHCSAFGMQ